jgi:hypothetical protein
VRAAGQLSNVTPIFTRTCQWATLPFSIWPRVSTSSNHLILLSLISALAMAFVVAGKKVIVGVNAYIPKK